MLSSEAAADRANRDTILRAATLELARLRRIRGPGRRTSRRIARVQVAIAAGLLAVGLGHEAGARTPVFVDPSNPFGLTGSSGHSTPTFGDLDGDGDLDALVGETQGTFVYLENEGTRASPAFGIPSLNPFGLSDVGDFSAPTFADTDRDGDLDVFVGNALGATNVFVNTGGATAPGFTLASGAAFGIVDVAFDADPGLADIDGDGDLDLFVGTGAYGNVVFFENTFTATAPDFGAPATNPFGFASVGQEASPRFADLDGDGDLDALVGNDQGNFFLFANTGTAQAPAFAAPVTNPFGLADLGDLAAPSFADLDGDGDQDVLAGSFAGNVILFANGGSERTPAFLGPVAIPDVGSYASPAFADLDGDGDLDALVGNGDGNVSFFANVGSPVAPSFTAASLPPGIVDLELLAAPDIADIDADGDLDLLIGTLDEGTFLFANTGSTIAPAFAVPLQNPAGLVELKRSAPALVDIDADGDLDVLMGALSVTAYFANTGTASVPAFAASVPGPFGLPDVALASTPAFVDLDADGDLDYLSGENVGNLTLAFNVGTPSQPAFALPLVNSFGLHAVGNGAAPVFADVDADGDPDLFVSTNDGTTTFFANVTPLCPAVADPGCAAFVAGSLSVDERKEGNEKLALKLAKGPALAQTEFGDPTLSGSQAISACIYDGDGKRAAALEVRRAGESCGNKPCWKPVGKPAPDGKGFAYKDPVGEADGVRSLKLAGGAEGRSSLALAASNRAKKDERVMPTGIALALAASPQVTIQVHGPGACFEVELTDVTKQEADRFKARSIER